MTWLQGCKLLGESYSVTLCTILDRHFRSCTSLRQTDYSITCCQCILIFLKFIIKSHVLLCVESWNFLNSVLRFKQNYTEVNQCLSARGKHLHKGNNSCTIPIYYNNSWGSLDNKQYYIYFSYWWRCTWYVEFNCAEILIIRVTSRNNHKCTSFFPHELWLRYLIFTTSQKTNVLKEFKVTFVLSLPLATLKLMCFIYGRK